MTMNDDDLPKENFKDFNYADYVVPVELSDATDDGGLFGFRFD